MREASGTASVSGATPSPTDGPGSGDAGDVARRHHQREAERRLAVGVRQRPGQRQPHRRRLARRQVADAHREDARPLLLGDGRAMPGLDGLIVFAAGGAALLQHALDHAAGHFHAEARHRRPVRQRKDVRRLQRFMVRSRLQWFLKVRLLSA